MNKRKVIFADHPLENKVFGRLGICCASPVEWAYYSSNIGAMHICCHCGGEGGTIDKNLKKRFKTVLPICEMCVSQGLEPMKKAPVLGQKRKK